MYKKYAEQGYELTPHAQTILPEPKWFKAVNNPNLNKWLMRINLTFILLIAAFVQISMAANGQRITISTTKKGASLSQVFKEIKRQSGFDFIYKNDLLKKSKAVYIDVRNAELNEVLEDCFENQPFSYAIQNNTIIVVESHGTNSNKLIAADIQVRGLVKDEAGLPLPGAGVRIKGSTTSTSTEVNGSFSIKVPDQNAVLIFSYVGYQPQEIVVGTQTRIEVQLKPMDNANLEEVAVVAFGTQKKQSLVGAQSSVRASELKQPVANLSSMLAGRLPGVIAVNRNGEPGSDQADIWIRGITNIGGDRNPLIVVDGVPNRPINGLSPYDIESFTILKDAAATAVYGIRGANGVILVNTKQGKLGSPQISVDYFEGVTTFTKKPSLIGGVDYMKLANEASLTEAIRRNNQSTYTPIYSDDAIRKTASKEDPILYPDVNWLEAIFKPVGHNRTATANLSGGVTNAKYYVSLGYYDEVGLLKTDDKAKYDATQRFSRYNVSTNLNWDITGTTKMDLGIRGVLSQGNLPGAENAQNIFGQAFQINPVAFPILYPNGSIPGISGQADQRNPYADVTRRGYRTNYSNQLFSNLRLTQDLKVITPGLSVTGMFSFDVNSTNTIKRNKRENTFYIRPNDPYNADGSYKYFQTYTGENFLGYATENGGDKKLYAEAALNYSRTFGKHAVSGLVIYNQNDNLTPFAGNLTLSLPYRMLGVAGRATYAYDDRYFAEVNVGYNGSENFAPGKRFGFFPAFGLGWIVSNEPFFKNLKNTFQLLKIRYSDGKVGSGGSSSGFAGSEGDRFYYLTKVGDRVGNNDVPGYTFGQTRNVSLRGLNVTAYGVDVTWSTTRKQDLGFEVKTLNNDLSIIVDLFKERRTGIFLGRGLVPNYIGLTSNPSGNLGETKNKGIDGTIEYIAKFSSDFDVTFRANYTYNKDVVVENDQAPTKYPYQELRGHNILARTGYIAEGLFTSMEEIAASPKQFGTLLPGDIKYKDLNGDGIIDAFDRTVIGRGDVPSSIYGFGFSARYKGFDLGAFFQGQHNADIILSGDAIQPFTASGGLGNLHSIATDRWTVDNPRQDAFYPRLSYGVNNNNFQTSTWWKRDISYLRLKNLDFGYTLNNGIKKMGVKKLRVYFTGYNVFTISKFKLWDPELATSNGTRYPLISTYSLGFTANF